jgi:DNA-binding NarL/FixJ family response regulator
VKCILIVDDSPIIRSRLRHLFEGEGLKVCGEAANGQEAIAMTLQLRPQVVVLDLVMPSMNGITAARILKKLVPRTQLILFSLSADLLNPEQLRTAGFSAVVSKNQASSLVAEAQILLAAA